MLTRITNLEADGIICTVSDYERCVDQDECYLFNENFLVRLTVWNSKVINILVYCYKKGPSFDLREFIDDLYDLPYECYEFRADKPGKYNEMIKKYGTKIGETYVINRSNKSVQELKERRKSEKETD